MSSKELATLSGKAPAALAARFGDDINDDLSAGVSAGFAVLSIRGSKWRIKHGGEETPILNEDDEPMTSLRVVVVKANPHVSKNYYEGKYVEGSIDAPTCYSIDGDRPEPDSPEIQNDICATCPKNVFGSRITENGKKAKACSDTRRMVVLPEGDLANERFGGPMLLRVPPTSLSELASYGRKFKGTNHRYNTVVTRLSFDMDTAYPRLQFKAVRPLNDDEANQLVGLLDDDEFAAKVESVLAQPMEFKAPADAAPQPAEDPLFEEDEAPKAAKPQAAKKPAAKPKPAQFTEAKPKPAEPDSDLDAELDDILASLDNLD